VLQGVFQKGRWQKMCTSTRQDKRFDRYRWDLCVSHHPDVTTFYHPDSGRAATEGWLAPDGGGHAVRGAELHGRQLLDHELQT